MSTESKVDKKTTGLSKPAIICASCSKELDVKKACSECKVVAYCNATCQLKDWDWHKLVCKNANLSYAKRNKLAKIPDSHAAYHPSKIFVRLVPEFVNYNSPALSVVIIMALHGGYKAVQIILDKELKTVNVEFRTGQEFVKVSGIAAVRKLEQVDAFNKTNQNKQTKFCIAISCPELSKKQASDPEFHILVTPTMDIDTNSEHYRTICKYCKHDDVVWLTSLFLSLAEGRNKTDASSRVNKLLLQKRFEADILEEMASKGVPPLRTLPVVFMIRDQTSVTRAQ